MTQLKMSDENDVAIVNNSFVLTDNNSDEEIVQRLKQRLRFFYGEWFLDKTKGVPYFQLVFVKGVKSEVVESAFIEATIETQGVSSLLRFDPLELDAGTRILRLRFDVKTINGETISINEALP